MAVDLDVRRALDAQVTSWDSVSSRNMFGGVAYMVAGKMFAMLMEGVLGMKLPHQLRAQALTLAGVSPFRSPSGGPFGEWIQFVILLDDDVPAVVPWLEAAFSYVRCLPAHKKAVRKRSG